MPIQVGLLLRLAAYWAMFVFVNQGTIAIFKFVTNGVPPESGLISAPSIATLIILPLCMFDLLVFSNRFAGPIVATSKRLKELAEHGQSSDLILRDGDLCNDLAAEFNKARLRFENLSEVHDQNSLQLIDCVEELCDV